MKPHIILISKDILRCDYLPTYGNKYYSTPNIDELAAKGTVFLRHYTAAPSTAMAFTSMFTGMYPYQTGRKQYVEVFDDDHTTKVASLFDIMETQGYRCHLVWSNNYINMAERFSKCFGKNTIHHENLELNQYVGAHMKFGSTVIQRDDDLTERTYAELIKEIDTINRSEPVFLWIHLPHVIKGRTGYGDDIDIFDRFIGDIRIRFGDKITITADHGCGNGKNGTTGYGFDVYESQIHIPLITPRINDLSFVDFNTSNTQLIEIISKGELTKQPFVLCDTAYYAQAHRKLAIIKDNYKYIYEKKSKAESLFDVVYDSEENINLAEPLMFDKDRDRKVVTSQVLFYPYWEDSKKQLIKFRAIKNIIWNNGTWLENIFYGSWRKPIRDIKRKINEIRKANKRKNAR